MVTLDCPWCDESSVLDFARLSDREATFTCKECGTSVALVEDPEVEMELAA